MKRFFDYQEKEFLLLSGEEIRELIEQEIDYYFEEDLDKSNYIKEVILTRYERKFYTGALKNTLYNDLKLKNINSLDSYKNEKMKKKVDRQIAKNKLETIQENKRRDTPERRYLRIMRDQFLISCLLDFLLFNVAMEYFPFLSEDQIIISYIFLSLITFVFLEIFFLPWNIAWARRHPSAWGILVVNAALGWTFIFWIISLIWASSQIEQRIIIVKGNDLK